VAPGFGDIERSEEHQLAGAVDVSAATGSFTSSACRIRARCGGADKQPVEGLVRYGGVDDQYFLLRR
jgi:hypothetical protein